MQPSLTIEELVDGLKTGRFRNIAVIAGAGISCGMYSILLSTELIVYSIGNSWFPLSKWSVS